MMDMDPSQLQFMQEMGAGYMPGTIPGRYAPLNAGGASQLSALSNPGNPGGFAPAIAGNPTPDVSPLAALNLQQYGVGGMLAGTAGNFYLSNMMNQQGLLPMGNAGSYMQASRTRDFRQMQRQVEGQVAPQDAASYYRTMQGMAALTGQPFNQQQQKAARGMANTIAGFSPMLSMMAPEFMDSMAGSRGSVQTMAAQMMEANRYRIDPASGQMGYSAGANADVVNGVFSNMFADDNMAQMQGLRAGDVGQMYRHLATEGLAGPRGSLRDRTIQAVQQAREGGANMQSLGFDAGVQMTDTTNLASLSNAELSRLRQTSGVKEKLSQSDTRQISDQLQGYVSSLSAMREVFGENGDLNAPVPKLINALKGLTSGQMQRFDSAQLNNIVRDMQALSQMSGKSIDQLVAMNRTANEMTSSVLGPNGIHFNQTATNVGVTTGMAVARTGGSTGFGALTREETEQAAMSLFSRGVGSEMGNAMGALTRIEQAGGFTDNEAGRQLKSAMAAADIGAKSYTYVNDAGQSVTQAVPTREMDFVGIVGRGAVEGMDLSGFHGMLGDRTANQRALSQSPDRQMAAMRQQNNEIDAALARQTGHRLEGEQALTSQIKDPRQLSQVAQALGMVATDTLSGLSSPQLQDDRVRNRMIADALKLEATNNNITLSDQQALTLAASTFGEAERGVKVFGFDSYTAKQDVLGPEISNARESQQALVSTRAGINQAMSPLGPKGSIPRRMIAALQKQGGDADLSTMLGDMFAGGDLASDKLGKPMQAVQEQLAKVEKLATEFDGATPETRQKLQAEVKRETEALAAAVQNASGLANAMGLDSQGGKFNREDLSRGQQAARELENLNRISQVRVMASTSAVSDADRTAAAGSKLTDNDYRALAGRRLEAKYAKSDAMASGAEPMDEEGKAIYDSLVGPEHKLTDAAARDILKSKFRSDIGTLDDEAAELKGTYGKDLTMAGMSQADQDVVIRARRASAALIPSRDAINDRRDQLRKMAGQKRLSRAERAALPEDQRASYDERERKLGTQSEDLLLAEGQLRSLGQLTKDQTLLDSPEALGQTNLDATLLANLQAASLPNRAGTVREYLDRQQLEQFYGTPEEISTKQAAARLFGESTKGQQAALAAEQNLGALSDTRREYLMDPRAVSQGGARGLLAAQQSMDAEFKLKTMANQYFGGSRGRMLASHGGDMTDAGQARADAEFAAMQKNPDAAVLGPILQRLRESGQDIDKLTPESYKAYLSLQARDAADTMGTSLDALSGGAKRTYADLLKPTLETQDLAKSLIGANASSAQESGLQALSSAAALKGVDLQTSLKGANLAQLTQQLASGGAVDTKGLSGPQQELVRLAEQMGQLSGVSSTQVASLEAMSRLDTTTAPELKALGMSEPEYAEAVRTGRLTDEQRAGKTPKQVSEILSRHQKFELNRKSLLESGMSEQGMNTRIETIRTLEQGAQKQAADLLSKDLGSDATSLLAGAFGKTEAEDRKAFKTKFEPEGSESALNMSLVANVLKGLNITETKGEQTAMDQLDALTDSYAKADPKERARLARQHGKDVAGMDLAMKQTAFLGMDQNNAVGKYTEKEFESAMLQHKGVDIGKSVQDREDRTLRIESGVLEVRGDFNGTGTLHNTLAVSGNR